MLNACQRKDGALNCLVLGLQFLLRPPVSVASMLSTRTYTLMPSSLFLTDSQIVLVFLSPPVSLAKGRRFHLITSWFPVKLGWVTLLHIAVQDVLICFFSLVCPVLKVNAFSFYFHRIDVRGHNINRGLFPLLCLRPRLSETFRNYHLQWKVSCSKWTEVFLYLFLIASWV